MEKGDTLAKRGKRRRKQRETRKKGKCILTKEIDMLDNQSNTRRMMKNFAPCTECGKKNWVIKAGYHRGNSNNLTAFFFSHSFLGRGKRY